MQYRAATSLDVWRFLGMGETRVEVRIERMRMWQKIVEEFNRHHREGYPERSCHIQLLAAMFGEVEGEGGSILTSDGRIDPRFSHPWLEQFVQDIESLRKFDNSAHIPEMLDGRMFNLFTEVEIAEDFVAIDMSIYRMDFLGCRVPPPGTASPSVEAPISQEASYYCGLLLGDGRRCTKTYASYRALKTHRTMTKGGEHGSLYVSRLCVVSSQCPLCHVVHGTVEQTKRHVTSTVTRGVCRGRGSRFCPEPIRPTTINGLYECPMCELHIAEFEHFQMHLASHISQEAGGASTIDIYI
jgi:hypothetical protein